MFFLLRRRIVRFLVMAIALPLLGAMVVKASNELEKRQGTTTATQWGRKLGGFMQDPGGRRRRTSPSVS